MKRLILWSTVIMFFIAFNTANAWTWKNNKRYLPRGAYNYGYAMPYGYPRMNQGYGRAFPYGQSSTFPMWSGQTPWNAWNGSSWGGNNSFPMMGGMPGGWGTPWSGFGMGSPFTGMSPWGMASPFGGGMPFGNAMPFGSSGFNGWNRSRRSNRFRGFGF